MLLPSSNRKEKPFPLLSYFSVVVCLRCLLHHFLSCIACTFRENLDFVFSIIVQFMMRANSWIRYGLQIVFGCLCITPSHVIIVHTYLYTLNLWNVCQIYFVECVSKIEHILLVIHYSIYGAVCFQFTKFPRDGWDCLGLGHEKMVCSVCLFIFLWTLQWRHNEHDGVSNHQPHDCLHNHVFRHRSKETSKLCVTGLCAGTSPVKSPHKRLVTRKMFPFDDVIMDYLDRRCI